MSSTILVNLKGHKNTLNYYDIYIGRAIYMGGWKLPKSKWANPFTIKEYGTAEIACAKYETWLRANPILLAQLYELKGKTIACWCSPNPCHGDVLIKLIKEIS